MTTIREALVAIAQDMVPCRMCGDAHSYKLHDTSNPNAGGSWAAADGHLYHRMSPAEFASSVLAKQPIEVRHRPRAAVPEQGNEQ